MGLMGAAHSVELVLTPLRIVCIVMSVAMCFVGLINHMVRCLISLRLIQSTNQHVNLFTRKSNVFVRFSVLEISLCVTPPPLPRLSLRLLFVLPLLDPLKVKGILCALSCGAV